MKTAIIRRTKWFWPWQDEQEETWLEEMSQQGLHLKRTDLFAQYEFIQGQPQNYAYRLDFQDSMKSKNKEEYLRLFTDAGWEYLGQLGGWQYFRKLTQSGEEREIFTDAETKIHKYNRFLAWFGLVFPSYLIVFVALLEQLAGVDDVVKRGYHTNICGFMGCHLAESYAAHQTIEGIIGRSTP